MATWGLTGQKHHYLSVSHLGYKEQKNPRCPNFDHRKAVNDVIFQNDCQNVLKETNNEDYTSVPD